MKLPEPDNIQAQHQAAVFQQQQQLAAAAAQQQQQQQIRAPIPPPPPQLLRQQPHHSIPQPVSLAVPVTTSVPAPVESGIDPSSIKLPGGATLVAVAEGGGLGGSEGPSPNKELEKPHVTITIGDKEIANSMNEGGIAADTANAHQACSLAHFYSYDFTPTSFLISDTHDSKCLEKKCNGALAK